jgi:cation diffusion facilitator CzcD-associated flavoprotein CzcO
MVPVVFEKHGAVGGVWRQDEAGPQQHSPAYDSLYTNSSRTMMQISDFPFPFKPSREFPSREGRASRDCQSMPHSVCLRH